MPLPGEGAEAQPDEPRPSAEASNAAARRHFTDALSLNHDSRQRLIAKKSSTGRKGFRRVGEKGKMGA